MPSSRYFLQNIFKKEAVNVNGNGIGRGFAASVPMPIPIPRQPYDNGMISSPLNATAYKPGMIRPM
jgi:hypothetical protein